MLTLEQVRALEARVEKAVNLIAALRAENGTLRSGLAAAEGRVAELEGLVREFQADQARIEEGIVHALRKLDAFEDAVHAAGVSADQAAPRPVEESPVEESPASAGADAPEAVSDEAAGGSGGDLDIF